jgi:hypothetical protein
LGILFVRRRQRNRAAVAELGGDGVTNNQQGRAGELGVADPKVELPSGQDPKYAEMEANPPQELPGSDVAELPSRPK